MRSLLNALFVTTQGAYLSKDGETVVVSVDHEVRLRLPILTLNGIVCFGNVSCSPFLLGFCGEKGVGVSFLTEHGQFLARVVGPVSGNVLRHRQQYRCAEGDGGAVPIAAAIVGAGRCRQSEVRTGGACGIRSLALGFTVRRCAREWGNRYGGWRFQRPPPRR